MIILYIYSAGEACTPVQSLAEARLNTRKQVKDLRLRVRAFGAIVGARHASPVKYAFGVYSVNALFTSYHEKLHTMRIYTS